MNEYILINYTKGKGACDHCGRTIKNIATIKNNVTGEVFHVGLTCVEKIMKLNVTFYKALSREIKKHYKCMEFYSKGLDIETNLNKIVKNNTKYKEGSYAYKSNEQMLEDAIAEVAWSLARMIDSCMRMNKLSKSGLIDIDILNSLFIKYKEYMSKFDENYNKNKYKYKSCYTMKPLKVILDENEDLKELYKSMQ
ncbi:TPA: hypothetical protein KRE72_002942 [Clostridioides difficile]|uniref:hypothetical protein n=1 Tax=Clostridioides difficile TaxID=1496 RepID=UPI00097FF47B|nr:hypothetical protein [Clostridioides difficile]MBY2414039.1 hypothetical protein [Clostridioides difficile]MDV9671812.1 hypothetical protein [Clostridioides difficile]MDV9700946.1 hypothetical protein [Clostridioides difficile]MDV9708580.1 hypothetical protein [Clostridioides difficile]MDV9727646.1 hypothetical protein [Clostridioides difficile]